MTLLSQLVVIALLSLAVLFLTFALLTATTIYVFIQARRRRTTREKLAAELGAELRGLPCFPVGYVGEARFGRLWKLLPWDGAGLLIPSGDEVIFLGQSSRGTRVEKRFHRADARITWLGQRFRCGLGVWFAIASPGECCYFAVEKGRWQRPSKTATREAYEALAGILPASEEPASRRRTILAHAGLVILAVAFAGAVGFLVHQLGAVASIVRDCLKGDGELRQAATLCRREKWDEAVPHLEKAEHLGVTSLTKYAALFADQARAYWHIGRFAEAVAAAKGRRRAQEMQGKEDDWFTCTLIAQALSFQYAETDARSLRDECLEWLDKARRLADKAGATRSFRIFEEATRYRLENRNYVLTRDYIAEHYPAAAGTFAGTLVSEGRFLRCAVIRDGTWAAIKLTMLESQRTLEAEGELTRLTVYAEGKPGQPLKVIEDPAGLPLYQKVYIEVPQAAAIESPAILFVEERWDGHFALEAFVIHEDRALHLPQVTKRSRTPFSAAALREAMKAAVAARGQTIQAQLKSGGSRED